MLQHTHSPVEDVDAASHAGDSSMSPYEESARVDSENFVDGIHERIRTELADFGQVLKIDGRIHRTMRHGIVFDDVEALLQHPSVHNSMWISVEWDSATDGLLYRGPKGQVLAPKESSSYHSTSPLSPAEQSVIDDVMGRYRELEIWKSSKSIQGLEGRLAEYEGMHAAGNMPGVSTSTGVVAIGLPFAAGAVPIVADLFIYDLPAGMTAIFAMGLMSIGGLAGMSLEFKESGKSQGREREKMQALQGSLQAWNANPRESFDSLFTSKDERETFMDAFLTLAGQAQISYRGGLQAMKAQTSSKNPSPAQAVLQFRGAIGEGGEDATLLFDGIRFYSIDWEGVDPIA